MTPENKDKYYTETYKKVAKHIEFIKNLTVFKQVIDDPVNHPREFEILRNSKDKKLKEHVTKLMPTLKKMFEHAANAMEYHSGDYKITNISNRIESLTYLSAAVQAHSPA
jgi:hypothetical protein